MPYDPHAQYTGGASLYGGMQSLGQALGAGIHEAIQERNKTQQELAADEQILNMGMQLKNPNDIDPATGQPRPYVTPDMHNEYLTGNDNKKKGIIAGLTRNFAMSMQQQQLSALEEQKKASAAYRNAEAQRQQALTTPPPPMSQADTDMLAHYGYLRQFTPGKGVEYLPQLGNDKAAASAPQISPFIDPSNGQPVPGLTQVYTPGHPLQIITNPDVKKPPSLQNYLGTGSGATKIQDLDVNAAFDSPNAKGFVEVPYLAPPGSYDPSAKQTSWLSGAANPKAQKYQLTPNPNYNPKKPASRDNPPEITKTIRVPKSVWQKFQGGAAVDEPATGQAQPAPTSAIGVQGGQTAPGYGVAPPQPPTPGTKIDVNTAAAYLQRHQGDVNAAQREAKANGWSF